jgi:Ca2+-binding RTX toxin-like protein
MSKKFFSDTTIIARIDQMQGFSSIEALTLRLVGSGGTLNLTSARQGHVDASGLTSGAVLTVGDGHYEGSLVGSNFNDTLSGSIRNDSISGGQGNDTLNGGTGHDTLLGIRSGEGGAMYNEGTDILNGGDGLDHLYGGGNDILNGGNGNDTIYLNLTGSGAIDGGADIDGIVANASSLGSFAFKNVEYLSSSHSLSGKLAQFNEFQGISVAGIIGLSGVGGTLNLSSRVESAIKVNASALTSAIVLSGGTEGDTLTGTNYNDALDGGAGNDSVMGGEGDDKLLGGYGVDRLVGGSGNDKLIGNAGGDTLYGGGNADTFVFQYVSQSTVTAGGRDTIFDFSRFQGDKIDLGAIDANIELTGNQAFKLIGSAGFALKAGELRFAKSLGDTFVQGDVDGDGQADFAVRVKGDFNFVNSDFVL